ncbi:MAG TPA: cation transporter [Syntrophorhabdales bacterium]|nr:cation transporter [Syntrophorhabdales bacterium]
MNYYIHDIPGRLRIESPVLRGNEANAQRFEAFVKSIPGVTSVEMKVEIGSAIVHYDPTRIDHTKLIELLEKSGYFDHLKAKTLDECIKEGVEKVADVAIKAAVGEVSE